MNPREIISEGVDWKYMPQNTVQKGVIMNTVMNFELYKRVYIS